MVVAWQLAWLLAVPAGLRRRLTGTVATRFSYAARATALLSFAVAVVPVFTWPRAPRRATHASTSPSKPFRPRVFTDRRSGACAPWRTANVRSGGRGVKGWVALAVGVARAGPARACGGGAYRRFLRWSQAWGAGGLAVVWGSWGLAVSRLFGHRGWRFGGDFSRWRLAVQGAVWGAGPAGSAPRSAAGSAARSASAAM